MAVIDKHQACVTHTVVVAAAPQAVFAVLANPHEHAGLDGSGLMRGVLEGPPVLMLGSVFRMRMKGYTTVNTVVEFEPGVLIAWRHRGRHVWRWRLRPVAGGTEVTETFDYRAKRARSLVELIGIPRRAAAILDKSLSALHARYPQPIPDGRQR
ncbi:SRPBCC family protein [Acrocarpospora sp. B8E8]|uniref:SRPBCC family protein n=1 Tax=Acrocarpospora sp. B8E8 TaxID=3153572 RepID=UPI00325D1194